MSIESLLIIGAGQMGAGIAQVAACAGLDVALNDVAPERVDSGLQRIDAGLAKLVEKGRMDAAGRQAARARVRAAPDLEAAAGEADLVIEAAPETLEVKRAIFTRLDAAAPPHAILATNTSSLPISQIAATTRRPGSVIGMHFFNPAPVMPLVEVVVGLATANETLRATQALIERMGKRAVRIEDYPGFCGNRIMIPMINEAVFALMEGVATAADIDAVAKLGFAHPMGPLALADLIGLDTVLSIMEILHDRYGDSKYRPCPLLRKYVETGWLGRKSGRGFFDYATR
ncbi:3-hydroxyacyl-CoA dehydrogenase NAD-binding domain-containing protein [Rhodoplanes sp. TEM]|uniref:3-hydroxyacyl-CoA dehydrogenase NAD-binding domain-containing protein n=1 Tax=Rhodoplanes tepidamans TaxID=200616 RepID=A0ABT5J7P9_RHOTP|nr:MULTISPECIES: 3-hydroxyacyl-CoA dehydrogenase NAD-binding domain-containing protein [Rhodoplanes]MDC7785679.1 3-hydroxyacyl-CoA dehydrogenase NAD-binding domain-containing protein [Rhodoplanes tepidamans]MDC7983320.1 3-hydroxyacyl-CoA dehydrogenase NAD-binding domain-containing protein [Rhodoplanes sp. TEM]MDQ0354753.1 3-hydroxybutyryl-CoA dehydrogenase [Rhodoplanes tepidamans]